MAPKLCCCGNCTLLDDTFDRADGDPGANWYGDGEIVSNQLVSDFDSITICSPAYAPLGSLYGTVYLVADTAITYLIRVGDPTGDYEVEVTFAGTVGVGTGTMTMEVRNGIDTPSNYVYDWEYESERIQICYEPGIQLSAGKFFRSSQSPDFQTLCIPLEPSDDCWTRDATSVGNWHFITGTYDDFHLEVHWIERKSCEDCDCKCWFIDDENNYEITCIPATLYATVDTDTCPDFVTGSFQMDQVLPTGLTIDSDPTSIPWPQKFEWMSEIIECPYTGFKFCFVLRCGYNTDDRRPRFRLNLHRWDASGLFYTGFGFDGSDPDTLVSGTTLIYDSYAVVKEGSTCSPLNLLFPDFIENLWSSSDVDDSCCGGAIYSDPEAPPATPSYFSVVITE